MAFAGGGVILIIIIIVIVSIFDDSCNKSDIFGLHNDFDNEDITKRIELFKQKFVSWNDTTIQKAKQFRAEIAKLSGEGNMKVFNAIKNANQQIIELAEKQDYNNMTISLDSANFMGLNFTLYYNYQNGKTIKLITMNSLINHQAIYVEYVPTNEHFLSKKSIFEEYSGDINIYNRNGILVGKAIFKNGKKINSKNSATNYKDITQSECDGCPVQEGVDVAVEGFIHNSSSYGGYYYTIGGGPGVVQNINNDGGGGGGLLPNPQDRATPCPGDPVVDPRIVPSKLNGDKNTGRYGDTRKYENGTPKNHDGTDYGCAVGAPFYAMLGGAVVGKKSDCPTDRVDKSCGGGYGNYIIVKSIYNGQYVWLKYNHASTISLNIGDPVSVSQQLGTCGETGNAWKIAYPHAHVQARTEGYGGDWSKNASPSTKKTPEDYTNQKFDQNGNPIPKTQPCN